MNDPMQAFMRLNDLLGTYVPEAERTNQAEKDWQTVNDALQAARAQGGEAVAYAAVNGKDRSRIAGLCTTEEIAELNAQRIGGDVRPLVFGDTHPSASVPDRLIEAVKALHIDDDMFGIDFQDEMATYQCQYCSFDMEHYGPSLDAYKLIKHDDDCPITKLRSLLATTPQPEVE